jgi:pyroglutamyl-peptidase
LPRTLKSSDADRSLKDNLDLRISEDAGRYLCDFIYFSSLAHLSKAKESQRVVFLHVPSDYSEQAITSGRELVLQLIKSIVESELARKGSKLVRKGATK